MVAVSGRSSPEYMSTSRSITPPYRAVDLERGIGMGHGTARWCTLGIRAARYQRDGMVPLNPPTILSTPNNNNNNNNNNNASNN